MLLASQNRRAFFQPIDEKNKRDKLYNDLVKLMKSKGLKLGVSQDEIDFGTRLLKCIRDILWYIDGAHQILGQHSRGVPAIFSKYNGYNVPKKSKHRKRNLTNLSLNQLNHMSKSLVAVLQEKAWGRDKWRDFKPDVLALAESLAVYAEYLSTKNKVMKMQHDSPNPVQKISQNIRETASTSAMSSTYLLGNEEAIYLKSLFEYHHITPLLPSDPLKRHRFVSTLLASGLKFSTVLLVYLPGSNVGNLHFLWKVPDDANLSNIFERSQSVAN